MCVVLLTCQFDFRQLTAVQWLSYHQNVQWCGRNAHPKNGQWVQHWKWMLQNLFHRLSELVIFCSLLRAEVQPTLDLSA